MTTILFPILLIILGFLLLIKGADWMVKGASSLAKKHHVSDLAIGLTIVAFGTSAPELVVNSIASFEGNSDIILGNVIGSNNFNLFVILGIVGLIYPISVQSSTVWKEIPISIIAVVVLFFVANGFDAENLKVITRLDGTLLLMLFLLFLFYVYKQLKSDPAIEDNKNEILTNSKIWLLIGVGLTGLVLGGNLVVDNATKIAKLMGVSQKIIGLTIVAAGTSLPELVTSVVAALKKNSDIAIGNIIGSNIFNILLILSVSSFINPIKFDVVFNTDIYLLAGGTIFLLIAMFTGKRKMLDRWEAGILLATFIVYTVYLVQQEF